MLETFCTECGKGERDGSVKVLEKPSELEASSLDQMPLESGSTIFQCDNCGFDEEISTRVTPTSHTTNFELREDNQGNNLHVTIDSKEICFLDIDEQISTATHYTNSGVKSTSRTHRLYIHAIDPPSLSKGGHRVRIGDYIDEEITLRDIRYHDSTKRTLKFFRPLDQGMKIDDSMPIALVD